MNLRKEKKNKILDTKRRHRNNQTIRKNLSSAFNFKTTSQLPIYLATKEELERDYEPEAQKFVEEIRDNSSEEDLIQKLEKLLEIAESVKSHKFFSYIKN